MLGRYLLQLDLKMGMLCPVTFYSKKLIGTEERYKIYDKKMLAIVECLKQWKVYLLGVAV